uniref:Uncharacterized protein n=1 Tax=Oryza sativa subsp. japonica TaxID=39947 RepID=Q6K337_ORYSJ|nr:hypothetical protein [Oryza sativa Japonica Group]
MTTPLGGGMTLERHRCQSGKGRARISKAAHHLRTAPHPPAAPPHTVVASSTTNSASSCHIGLLHRRMRLIVPSRPPATGRASGAKLASTATGRTSSRCAFLRRAGLRPLLQLLRASQMQPSATPLASHPRPPCLLPPQPQPRSPQQPQPQPPQPQSSASWAPPPPLSLHHQPRRHRHPIAVKKAAASMPFSTFVASTDPTASDARHRRPLTGPLAPATRLEPPACHSLPPGTAALPLCLLRPPVPPLPTAANSAPPRPPTPSTTSTQLTLPTPRRRPRQLDDPALRCPEQQIRP